MAAAQPAASGGRVPFHLRPNYKWAIVAMLWFMCFFNYADRSAIVSMKPLLTKSVMPAEYWGWVGASFALVYGLFAPFAGNVGDLFRRKNVILIGLYAWSLICALTALSRNFWQLMFFRAAEGLGETFYFPATTSLLSDYHDKRTRSRALGLHNTGVYAGTVGGAVFGGLIGQRYGWKTSFIVFGLLGMVLGIVLSKFIVEPRRGAADLAEAAARSGGAGPEHSGGEQATASQVKMRPSSSVLAMLVYAGCIAACIPLITRASGWAADVFGEGGRVFGLIIGALPGVVIGVLLAMRITYGAAGMEFLRRVFGTPTVLVLMLVFMGANAVFLVAFTWMTPHLNEKFNLGLAWAGLGATAPMNLFTIPGAALGGVFADWLRRRTAGGRMIVQALALLACVPFVYLAGLTNAFLVLLVALAFWGFFKGMYDASIFASAFDVMPARFRGTTAGFMNMAGWMGGAPGPVLIGWISQQYADKEYGLSVGIASASALYVLAAIVMLLGVALFVRRDTARMERELRST